MQRAIWIGGIVIVLLLIGGVFYWLSGTTPTGGATQTQNPPFGIGRTTAVTPITSTSTTGQTTTNTLTLRGQGGTTIAVNNFLTDPDVDADTARPGTYALAGGLTPTSSNAPYSIVYFADSQSFVVTLLQDPLGSNRHLAEATLQQYTGLTEQDMCALNYYVGVPEYASEQYAGTNLGFSFCPGATQLP